jgi:hypothetical protein
MSLRVSKSPNQLTEWRTPCFFVHASEFGPVHYWKWCRLERDRINTARGDESVHLMVGDNGIALFDKSAHGARRIAV